MEPSDGLRLAGWCGAVAEWTAYTPPPGSYTPDEQAAFVQILSTILDSPEAVEGLLETMASE